MCVFTRTHAHTIPHRQVHAWAYYQWEVKQYKAPPTPGHSEVYMVFGVCDALHKCHRSTSQGTTLCLRTFHITAYQNWWGETILELFGGHV